MRNLFYLLNLKLSGIKNIENEIQIDFYKKTVDKSFDADDYKVKGIYGENGSGKTAIVTAVQILKNLMCSGSYLTESSNQKILRELVNKKTGRLCIVVEFKNLDATMNHLFRYRIEISKDTNSRYLIASESLEIRSANYAAAKYHPVYMCEKGELVYVADLKSGDFLRKITANLLDTRSLLSVVLDRSSEIHKEQIADKVKVPILASLLFAFVLRTSIEESDQHTFYLMQQSEQLSEESFISLLAKLGAERKHSETIVARSDFENYRKSVKQLEAFIKCFKRDLIEIEIDKREDHDYYDCRLIMKYKDYRVDSEFESNGIRKLMRNFDYMQFVASGGIAFIDEMDSNINDVYLCKLIDYFMKYGKGQLCFTTHNTSPMAVLRDGKNSIDFLSNDGRIIPWKKNGNFSPENLYRNGMIEYLPFNIEAEDFIGILGD